MKKVLALFLALMMVTVSLAACKKEPSSSLLGEEGDDDGYVVKPNNSDTSDTSDTSNTTGGGTQTGVWTDTGDTMYAGVDELRLRTSADSGNNVAKKVNMGTKLNRISTNGVWSKVTVEGDTNEYYVSNAWLSSNVGDFNFTETNPAVALTIGNTDNNILFFESPFEADGDAYYENVVCASGFKVDKVSSTYTLEKIGTSASGNWIKVKFVGTITITATNTKTYTPDNPGILYVKMRAITRGDIVDPTYTSNNPGGDVGGHG